MNLFYTLLMVWLMLFQVHAAAAHAQDVQGEGVLGPAAVGTGSAREGGAWMEDPFADEEKGPAISDPLEGLNRKVFAFNDKVYRFVLIPVSRGYGFILPQKARECVSNFFSNLVTPVRFMNCLFQKKFREAGGEIARFCINTTFGVAGLFDPARSHWKVKKHREDFGQTLGRYGYGQGAYLVVPLLGPLSTRDGLGMVVDLLFDPQTYYLDLKPWLGVRTLQEVNYTSFHPEEYEDMVKQAMDPYLFMRSSYVQYRARLVSE